MKDLEQLLPAIIKESQDVVCMYALYLPIFLSICLAKSHFKPIRKS